MPPWMRPLFHPSLWNWGDVATWFTGIFTALPLFIVLWQLRRNSKRESIRQAKSIVVFETVDYDADSSEAAGHVHVWNYSDRPIFRVSMLRFLDSWNAPVGVGEILEGHGDGFIQALLPGKEHVIDYILPEAESFGYLGIVFSDTESQTWAFNIITERLQSHGDFLKFLGDEQKRRNKVKEQQSRLGG